jgi:hypothetical protein
MRLEGTRLLTWDMFRNMSLKWHRRLTRVSPDALPARYTVYLSIQDHTGYHLLPRSVRLLACQERSYLSTAPHTGVPKSHPTIRGRSQGFGSISSQGKSAGGFEGGSAPGSERVSESVCIMPLG